VRLGDGRSLAWSEVGAADGPVVVWCHGGLSCRLDVRSVRAAAETAGIRVLAPDRPGIGGSDRARGHTVAAWARDVGALLDHLAVTRAGALGWSAGGPYALALGAGLPDRIGAIATYGGMAPVPSRSERRELGLAVDRVLLPLSRRAPAVAGLVLGLERHLPRRLLSRSSRRALPAPDRALLAAEVGDPVMEALTAALAAGVGGTVDDYRAFGGDWGFDPGAIGSPVLVHQGELDTLVPMSHAQRLARLCGAAEPAVAAGAGHFLPPAVATDILGAVVAAL
jgi:pimeloyl-ACP methyl ester carboxylesterase